MSGEHSILPPSFFEIMVPCNGALSFLQMFPEDEETDEQKEGTAAHWVALQYAQSNFALPGDIAPNGVEVTDEMVDGAILYVEAIGTQQYRNALEKRVEIKRVHDLCWGTPDYRDYDTAKKILRVIDYKFGHVGVDPFENLQLVPYASGAMDEWGLNDLETIIEFTIVRPRYYGKGGTVERWRTTGADLRGIINRISNAAHMALSANATTVSGNHCLYCPGRHACETYQRSVATVLDFSGSVDVMLSTPAQVGKELTLLEAAITRLKGRLTGLQGQATDYIRKGQNVPGYAMEAIPGREVWKIPVSEVIALGVLFDRPLVKEQTTLTPAQARKLGIDAAVISEYVERPKHALKLTAVSTQDTRKIFGK